jgi:hypothetical protein
VLIGVLALGEAYAEEGSSGAHGDGKASAAPAESGDHASAKGPSGEGAKGEAHPSSGGDGKGAPGGSNERSEPAKDAAPSNADTHVEPVRRMDKKDKPGEANPPPRMPGDQGVTRRQSPLPQAPNPVRNSIGVAVPPSAHVEPREGTHLPTVAPRPPSVTAPLGPGNASARPGKPEFANRPAANPTITAPAASRGAINGTGGTGMRNNVGPPRIGGPSTSAVGINGTAIRSKH